MKSLLMLLTASFFLTSCAYGLKYIDKSKTTSSDWEPVADEKSVTKTDTKTARKKK